MAVIWLQKAKSKRAKKNCVEIPQSAGCTDRLHNAECPGTKEGKGSVCESVKFDPKIHNPDLPKFFAAQH